MGIYPEGYVTRLVDQVLRELLGVVPALLLTGPSGHRQDDHLREKNGRHELDLLVGLGADRVVAPRAWWSARSSGRTSTPTAAGSTSRAASSSGNTAGKDEGHFQCPFSDSEMVGMTRAAIVEA